MADTLLELVVYNKERYTPFKLIVGRIIPMKTSTKGKFYNHKMDAERRGIAFLFTFEEWLKFWMDSGHWKERGCHKGQYVMARFGDKGPYASWNVSIIKAEENCRDGNIGRERSEGTRMLISKNKTGKKMSEEFCEQVSIRLIGNTHAKGKKWSSEACKAFSKLKKAKKYKFSPESNEKKRQKMLAYWAARKAAENM